MAGLSESLTQTVEIELGDKTYKAGILTLSDWAAFEEFAKNQFRKKIIATAKEIYGDDMPPEVLKDATRKLTQDELDDFEESISGITFLLARSLKKFNPAMEQDDISAMISIVDAGNIMRKIAGISAEKKTQSDTETQPNGQQ